MQTDTGRFIIDEKTRDALKETQADLLKNLNPIVLSENEEMPENSIQVKRLPDPNCPKCFGAGHKPRQLATQKYHPCPCVL